MFNLKSNLKKYQTDLRNTIAALAKKEAAAIKANDLNTFRSLKAERARVEVKLFSA